MSVDLKAEFKLDCKAVADGGKTTAIIVGGGNASRMGGLDKILLPLAGIPTIVRSIKAFENCEGVDNIVLVLRKDMVNTVQNLITDHGFKKVTDLVEGGQTRAESVKAGLAVCDMATDVLLIHDGARPLITKDIIESVMDAVELYGAAAPGVPLKDTVKIVDPSGKILDTPDRNTLVAIQTPQGFKMPLYVEALSKFEDAEITDDCGLLERAGHSVYTVEGSYENIKITTPEDVEIAEGILRKRGEAE